MKQKMKNNNFEAMSSSVTELDLKKLESVNGGSVIGTIIIGLKVAKVGHTAWSLLNPPRAKAPSAPVWQGGRRSYA